MGLVSVAELFDSDVILLERFGSCGAGDEATAAPLASDGSFWWPSAAVEQLNVDADEDSE